MPVSWTEPGPSDGTLDRRKIAAARLWASAQLPYLASGLFALSVVARPDCDTISVDRAWHLHADPAWVDRLDVEELGKLFIHLVGHLLREHADRAAVEHVEEENARARWNRAADAELNDDLALDGLVPASAPDLPRDLACDDARLAEHYFRAAGDGPRGWDCGSGCDNAERPWDQGDGTGGIDGGQGRLLRQGVAAGIQRHAGMHPGTVPGGWLRWAEEILPSRVDWRRVLAGEIRRSVTSVAGNVDYTYRRPSRRQHAVPRVVLPAMQHPVPTVAIVCDTSGSMHEQLLGRALAEVEGILAGAGLRQTQVRVLAVDTNVHAVRRVGRADQVQLAGGGGTDMGAGIAAAASLRPRPSVIIVLTDGYTPWPPRGPKSTRVIVGILTQGIGSLEHFPVPPWARTVRIDQAAPPVRR